MRLIPGGNASTTETVMVKSSEQKEPIEVWFQQRTEPAGVRPRWGDSRDLDQKGIRIPLPEYSPASWEHKSPEMADDGDAALSDEAFDESAAAGAGTDVAVVPGVGASS